MSSSVDARPRAIPALFKAYDEVRVVSLPRRIDRRHALDRELARFNAYPVYYHAVECAGAGPFIKPGSHGAFLSHLALLRWAGRRKRSILILQDDCTFTPGATLQSKPAAYDIWYGGWESMDVGPVERARLIGAHCIGFSAKVASDAAAYLQERYDAWRPGDAPLPPIDGLLVEFRWSRADLRVGFDLISIQRSSRSDVSPGRFDRHLVASALIGPLRKAKTIIRRRKAGTAAPVSNPTFSEDQTIGNGTRVSAARPETASARPACFPSGPASG